MTTATLCVNCGYSSAEYSDWAVAAIYVYNRELSDSEITAMEAYLAKAYGIPCEHSW